MHALAYALVLEMKKFLLLSRCSRGELARWHQLNMILGGLITWSKRIKKPMLFYVNNNSKQLKVM